MTTAITAPTPAALPRQRPAPLQPLRAAETVALLARNFALVKPVGMTEDAAHEWLTVAASEVRHLPAGVLQRAATKARQTCTHHAQIIPAILATSDAQAASAADSLQWDRSVHGGTAYLEPPRWQPEPGETAAILADAMKALKADRDDG